jgi:indole-3-glycerol phosphate synthase
MTSILDQIVDARLKRLKSEIEEIGLSAMTKRAEARTPAADFASALQKPGVNIIAEIKKASPSRGIIREDLDPAVQTRAYDTGGAAAISVLTEQDYFKGGMSVLAQARSRTNLPILRKDFILDPYQIVEARAYGADSILLIAAILDSRSLGDLLRICREWRFEPLVEVHTKEELEETLSAGAKIIGINNRNLKTFQVSIETSVELAEHIPKDRVIVSESGIKTAQDIALLRAAGVNAFLIGEELVRADDPAAKLHELRGDNGEVR